MGVLLCWCLLFVLVGRESVVVDFHRVLQTCLSFLLVELNNWFYRLFFLFKFSKALIPLEDETVHKELGDSLVRAATTASSLEAEQDSGGGPRCQETVGDTIAQTRFENVSKHSNDSLLARGHSHNEITSLKRRVKEAEKKYWFKKLLGLERLYKVGLSARVESSDNKEILGKDASKQGRIDAIDADKEITLLVFKMWMKRCTKPKEKEVVIQELCESTTIISSQQSEDKGKGILIEHVKPMKKKIQIRFDEETTLNLQDEFDDEEIFVWKAKKEKQELIQESTKKQKVEDDKEITELKQCLEIILDEEEVTIDDIPLAVKSPSIVGWKIYKEGRKGYYK
ncbi:hypothetical protein Tco_0373340 [Tanacetum coccineum]